HTVLFIEHNMGIVMNISDTVPVMRAGRVLVEGPPAHVRDDPEVRRAYLGNMITGDLTQAPTATAPEPKAREAKAPEANAPEAKAPEA
ncbi:hypothetical protein MKK54_01710, partial [Methylobacterium sp. J-068]|nr:hypothetical protein [Methylobacterium sp. J-068]